jgi:putative hydrolase of HD superfamily
VAAVQWVTFLTVSYAAPLEGRRFCYSTPMQKEEILAATDEEIIQIAHQLRIGYGLKKTLRYSGSRDFSTHGESVAEHVFALLFLAQYFLPLEDAEGALDKATVYETLLFHDFGEILNGDIPYHQKTAEDEAREMEDAKQVFNSLPPPLNTLGRKRWEDYEEHKTVEARFVYALDKMEPLFELFDPINETSMRRLEFTYEMNIERKLKATEQFPVMQKFVQVLSDDMKKRGVFFEG